ncbi:MAG: glycosyltransferase [Lactobacillaceae bacterium]|jgi:glycosyltransferase involved in cell wall biosynthesis|nr:glycosyltransferase [Lactobacillaceae bacterium]
MTKIQVLMSVYNGELYLKEQIQSILNQKGVDVFLLIRDDHSADSSVKIIREFMKNNSNIQLIQGKNVGVIESFFQLIRKANPQMDFYSFSDQDDVWMSNKLLAATQAISQLHEEKPRLYISRSELVDANLKHIDYSDKSAVGPQNAIIMNAAIGHTIVFDRALRKLFLSKKPDATQLVMHDSWLYKIASFFGQIYFDDNYYTKYRQHGDNKVGMDKKLITKIKNTLEASKKKLFYKEIMEFNKLYKKELPEKYEYEISRYFKAKKHFYSRFIYLLHPYIQRDSLRGQIIFRVFFLLNMK